MVGGKGLILTADAELNKRGTGSSDGSRRSGRGHSRGTGSSSDGDPTCAIVRGSLPRHTSGSFRKLYQDESIDGKRASSGGGRFVMRTQRQSELMMDAAQNLPGAVMTGASSGQVSSAPVSTANSPSATMQPTLPQARTPTEATVMARGTAHMSPAILSRKGK